MRKIDADLEAILADYARMAGRPRRGWKHGSVYDLVHKEGEVYSADPYSPEEEALVREILAGAGRTWETRQCFYNSQVIALHDCRLEYAEGFVLMPDIPLLIEHGWNALNGKPVDVTLRERSERATCDPEKLLERAAGNLAKNAYRGIPIPKDEIRKIWLRTERAEAILYWPDIQAELLRHGLAVGWRR